MPQTREERMAALARGRATAAANRAAREAPAPETDDVLAQLGQALIAASGSSAAKQARVVHQIEELLNQLDPKAYPELLENETLQAFLDQIGEKRAAEHTEDPPGTVYGSGLGVTAKPWTWAHVEMLCRAEPEGMFRKKTVSCTKTQQVIVNGLGVWFPEGQEVTFYAPWVDQYIASFKAAKDIERHRQWLLKVGPWDAKIPAQMQPPPDADWLLDETGVPTRAGGQGMYMPGMGWNPAVDGRRDVPDAVAEPEAAAA